MTVKKALFKFLDEHDDLTISGWQLFDIVKNLTGRCLYPTTLLNFVREYCDITGSEFNCVNHNESVYHFIQLVPLGDNYIIDRK